MSQCMNCRRSLTFHEMGAYKKFINRGSREYLCLDCLADKLAVTTDELEEKIQLFIQQGCTLFYPQ